MSRVAKIAIPGMILLALVAWTRSHKGGPAKPNNSALAGTGLRPAPVVRATPAQLGSITETIFVNGNVEALTRVTLSPKIAGKVALVTVREGDPVRKGQVVVQFDPVEWESAVRQAEAGVETARTRLDQAQTALRLEEERVRSNIAQAEETLRSAQARLTMVRTGARAQERMVARNAVSTAEANLKRAEAELHNAQLDYQRIRNLYQQGAIPQSQLDSAEARLRTAEANVNAAQAQLDSARQNLSLIEEGARREEIETAEANVAQAQDGLRLAKEGWRQVEMRRQDVVTARASLRQAQSQLLNAQKQLSYTTITSPINGFVSKRFVEVGQTAVMGSPLLEIVDLNNLYFAASVPEEDFARLKVGMPVEVTLDALPGKTFNGKVSRLYPSGDPQSRTFIARIDLHNIGGLIRPGMFARGRIQVGRRNQVVLIPKEALEVGGHPLPIGGGASSRPGTVFVVEKGIARKRSVKVGVVGPEKAEIQAGLRPGELVITLGQGIADGDKVNVAH